MAAMPFGRYISVLFLYRVSVPDKSMALEQNFTIPVCACSVAPTIDLARHQRAVADDTISYRGLFYPGQPSENAYPGSQRLEHHIDLPAGCPFRSVCKFHKYVRKLG